VVCEGRGDDHCCYLGKHGGVCRYLVESTGPRRWVCTLRRELGSWQRVHTDRRYLEHVQPFWDEYRDGSGSCGSWPLHFPDIMSNPAMGRCCYEGVSVGDTNTD